MSRWRTALRVSPLRRNAYVVQEAGTQADTSRGLFRRSQTGGNRHRRGAAWVKRVHLY